jgi:hypothetical protein
MFLMPKRALSEGFGGGICDVTQYFSVGRMDRAMLSHAFSSGGPQTVFAQYSDTDEEKGFAVNPHSLRHLQNTELFRAGLADTVITKRFGRRSVAQSHEYDHRTLSEELDNQELPPELESLLGEKASTVAKMIMAGKATGPLIDGFRRLQREQGDDAAFEYLKVEADGFHITPYGYCLNSFTVDPCPKHLECFNGCRHLSVGESSEQKQNLIRIEIKLTETIESIEGHPSKTIGSRNQYEHAVALRAGVRKLLIAKPGELVFPDGPDLSKTNSKNMTVLDGQYD